MTRLKAREVLFFWPLHASLLTESCFFFDDRSTEGTFVILAILSTKHRFGET
jgi:hypothetical protein